MNTSQATATMPGEYNIEYNLNIEKKLYTLHHLLLIILLCFPQV